MMRGRVTTFIGSIMMIMIGVGIIWWFRSVMPSEAFIVSERHKESFSTLNYLELARKTLEEAAPVYAQTGASKAGAAGGLDNTVPQKDGIAVWKISPGGATIKDTLKRYITDEMASMQSHPVTGKYITVTYGSTNVELVPDNDDFSKSEKFYLKGDKNIEVSKGLDTQAIKIKTSLKGHIDNEIKLKYFALYAAAKSFLESGEPVNRIGAAFGVVNTEGEVTHATPSCGATIACADNTGTCPASTTTEPTDAEVRGATDFPLLDGKANSISGAIAGLPFTLFNAKYEKHYVVTTSDYTAGDKLVTSSSCEFKCNYEAVVKELVCTPSPDPEAPPDCKEKDVKKTLTNKCASDVITSKIRFTFLVDAYEKYSSEDPDGLVPSKTLNMVPVVAKTLPYETLKFNFMTHSCTTMKSGYVTVTELIGDASACTPAAITPV